MFRLVALLLNIQKQFLPCLCFVVSEWISEYLRMSILINVHTSLDEYLAIAPKGVGGIIPLIMFISNHLMGPVHCTTIINRLFKTRENSPWKYKSIWLYGGFKIIRCHEKGKREKKDGLRDAFLAQHGLRRAFSSSFLQISPEWLVIHRTILPIRRKKEGDIASNHPFCPGRQNWQPPSVRRWWWWVMLIVELSLSVY